MFFALGPYEITPYATFNVPSIPNSSSRSVNSSTLDFTMHIKTRAHLEDEEHNMVLYPKDIKQLTWHKNRYYGNEGKTHLQLSTIRTETLCPLQFQALLQIRKKAENESPVQLP